MNHISPDGMKKYFPHRAYIKKISKPARIKIGFTLIETIVAVAILIAAVVGPVALIGHSLFSASFSRNDLIANNLAQEGIELFRAIRDNNVLCASLGGTMKWNDNPDGGNKFGGYYEIDAVPSSSINLSCGSGNISTPLPITHPPPHCSTPLQIDVNGEYSYIPGGTVTYFTRCIKVCSPPSAPPCFGVNDGDIPNTGIPPNSNQMEIISTVSWSERGTPKSVTLKDRLYNW